jgi:GR25 family glycosyltransferase involved in LPS biosynthesis
MPLQATVIHLEKATERASLIENLKGIFDLEIFHAKDGSEWATNPQIQKKHPHIRQPISQGNIGCTHSHIELIHGALKRKDSSIIILEDDCHMKPGITAEDIMKFSHLANTLGQPWDILLLGASEYVESTATSSPQYKKVNRFWGTHALILRERGMRAVLKAFAESQRRGEFLPADWLYNEAIKIDGLVCYGPADHHQHCEQKVGLVSYITGTTRLPRNLLN